VFLVLIIFPCMLNAADDSEAVATQMAGLATEGQRLLVYSVRAITNRQILPVPNVPASIERQLSLRACRGEYEPASFVMYPLEEVGALMVSATKLRGRGGVISSDAVDIRAVKVWYQSGDQSAGGYGPRRNSNCPLSQNLHLLTPELLLKDDGLVRVDYLSQNNYLRLDFPEGRSEWRCVSDPENPLLLPEAMNDSCPVRDAESLQPLEVPVHRAKQMWVTVHVPDDTAAGVYRGYIEISESGRLLERLRVRLEVLPFELAPNPLESSMYFHWGDKVVFDGPGSVSYKYRSAEQYRAELQNLLAHGVNNPTVGMTYGGGTLPEILRIRAEVGMAQDNLYLISQSAAASEDVIKNVVELAREFGYSEVYLYGRDEARGEALNSQRETWIRTRELGAKLFMAGYRADYPYPGPGNFDVIGDIQDLLVAYGIPSREEAARWHSRGHKIFCYAHPQTGFEAPETYRRNFGLLLYLRDYDGGMTYIYYHNWNDFGGRFRAHNMVYPTVDGVIDTVQWEGYREGIDDLRYVATLNDTIRRVRDAAPGPLALGVAAEAEHFLASVDVNTYDDQQGEDCQNRSNCGDADDLYRVRDQFIELTLMLLDSLEE